jgi:hypothetical protein
LVDKEFGCKVEYASKHSNLDRHCFHRYPKFLGDAFVKKICCSLGGSLQMDLSYATIPTCDGTFVTLNREKFRRYHVEDPKQPRE